MITLLVLSVLTAAGASAEPPLRCLWTPPRAVRASPRPGTARIQYTQFFDDALAGALARSLGSDRTLLFRYETDYPDDHLFPNGVTMGRIHQWLTAMLEAWNQEPLMPVRLRLERGQPATENVVFLDDTSQETEPNTGRGGYSYEFDGEQIQFRCRAALNVDSGSVTRRELMEALAKHELGHCLALRHSSSRAAVMGYSTGSVDYGAWVGFISLDDLLGLRSVWARNASGFGSLAGRLLYPDGTPVGGGDVAAIDATTGTVIATSVSDGAQEGYYRIELPARRQVRLVAHPLHADAALFGDHFLPAELITPPRFAPTEMKEDDKSVVITVPESVTRELPAFTVSPPAEPPLDNLDAPVAPLLPGERAHLAFRFSGLEDAPVEVRPSLTGLTITNVVRVQDRVEFDVSADPETTGVSSIEFLRGEVSNVQIGSIWVRPVAGLVRATAVAPVALVQGMTTELTVSGIGLDRVTGARLVSEEPTTELEARVVESGGESRLKLEVDIPADAPEGPWDLLLLTSAGEAPLAPEPRPRLWVTRGRIEAEAVIDLGEVKLGQSQDLSIETINHSTTTYRVTNYRWITWVGEIDGVDLDQSPRLEPGDSGDLKLKLTPSRLGPTAVTFLWHSDDGPDAVTEVRLWAIP